jgi:hypothetical protein
MTTTDRRLHPVTTTAPTPLRSEPIRSHDHALKTLDDGPYLAYVLVQMFKFGTSLIVKRWAHLR